MKCVCYGETYVIETDSSRVPWVHVPVACRAIRFTATTMRYPHVFSRVWLLLRSKSENVALLMIVL